MLEALAVLYAAVVFMVLGAFLNRVDSEFWDWMLAILLSVLWPLTGAIAIMVFFGIFFFAIGRKMATKIDLDKFWSWVSD